MAKFDPYIKHILTKIYDDNFVNDITEQLNELLPLLINGDLRVFDNTEKNNELLSSLKLQELNLNKTLTYDTDINGVRNKTGFNQLTIMSTFLDQDVQQFLNDISSDFTQLSIQLDQMSSGFSNNSFYFQTINQNVQKYASLISDLLEDEDIHYRFFNFIANRNVDSEDSGKIAFLYIYSFFLLYLGYSKLTKYQSSIFYQLIDNDRLNPTDIANEFSIYYDRNTDRLVDLIEQYCYKNIFKFSGNYTTLFDSAVDEKVSQSLQRLVNMFVDNVENFTQDNKFLTNLLATSVDQLSYYTSLERLDDFYDNLDQLFDVDVFGVLGLEEDRMYQDVADYARDNLEDVESLEYVAWQFNATPLYFINTHYILHYQYASNLVDEMKVPFNIDSWANMFDFTNDRNYKYKFFFSTRPFVYSDHIVDRCAKYLFSDLIDEFMRSPLVTQWIISDFFPSLLKGVNSNYYKQIDIYKYIDNIRWIIKLIFVNDIFNEELFNSYTSQLRSYISSWIATDYSVNFSDITVDLIFANYPRSQIQNFLNGLTKSSFVDSYLKALLSKYSI